MALTPSSMLPLGTKAPDFALPEPLSQSTRTRDELTGDGGLLVMFICNHCPYVKHIRDELIRLGRDAAAQGVGVVAVSANDAEHYPDDAPEKMAEEARRYGYPFPYLYDADQSVARAYQAACTPDFFLFDAAHALYYRGRLDGATPGNDEANDGRDLRAALTAMLGGKAPPEPQQPSMGCNIKWRAVA
ncbi:thioredoxin family protein [Algiphilus sp.]|uniref:thioredoxin family protein n=1 Tax=Algiphilus sp. TaxID=1872431 RepID=UPI002A686BA1|nr:thioredoxin family protein [Pseudomonadota bacterium]